MKEIPLPITANCLHPQRIFNSFSNQWITAPCGHCKACRLNKNSRLAFQCDLEAHSHEYVVFLTLTYSDRHVPKFRFVSSLDDPLTNMMVDCETGESLGEIELTETNKELILNKCNLNGCIPYLRKQDAQAFMKRFRYYASKFYKGKIRYFCCGEYGPVHYRPHFHFLLYFSDKSFLQVCEECVLQAWSFGRIDCQLSQGKTSSYVASYVNCSGNLPRVYEFSTVRPFSLHSVRLGQSILQNQREAVYSQAPLDFIQRSINLNGQNREFRLWRSCYSYFYPKVKAYADKSASELFNSYTVYRTAKNIFCSETCAELAKDIAFYCRDYDSVKDDIYQLPKYQIDRFVYLYDHYTDSAQNAPFDSEEWIKYINRIYTDLLVSRHFLTFVCDHDPNKWPTIGEIKSKIRRIQEFYSRLDFLHLKDFFENQQRYYESDLCGDEYDMLDRFGNSFNPFFYDNCPIYGYKKQELYYKYEFYINKIANDRIKHKKLNDMNKIFMDI